MDAFLLLPDDRRRLLCEEAGRELSLSAGSVEKDFWVCWTLKALFALPTSGAHLTFKGGTSLSKGWKLIQRFSEDIDLVIDRDFLGFGGEHSPEDAPSNKQRAKRLEGLMEACQRHIRDSLMPDFEQHVRESLPEPSKWRIESDPDDPDEQTVLFHYPAAAAGSDYIRAVVKIELGARSDIDPSAEPHITPYVAEVFPAEIGNSTFSVRTVAPERTFWEKVALLHEEEHRTTDDPPKARLARHYYDIWSLIQAGIGEKAMADTGLFERVAAHRVIFFRKNREAQASLRAGSLHVVPSVGRRSAWKQDYEVMRESMFFGETPSFDDILAVVADFEQRFNIAATRSSTS